MTGPFVIEPDEDGTWPTLREAADAYLLAALERNGNNKPQAASQLGISLKTIYNHLNAMAVRSNV